MYYKISILVFFAVSMTAPSLFTNSFNAETCEDEKPLHIKNRAVFASAGKMKEELNLDFMSIAEINYALDVIFTIESKWMDDPINEISDARGVIQFMPRTRRTLNIPENIHQYRVSKQQTFVRKYFRHKWKTHKIDGRKVRNWEDLYMTVLFPRATTKGENYTLFERCNNNDKCAYRYCKDKNWATKGQRRCGYCGNHAFDLNKDYKVTKKEVRDFTLRRYNKKNLK